MKNLELDHPAQTDTQRRIRRNLMLRAITFCSLIAIVFTNSSLGQNKDTSIEIAINAMEKGEYEKAFRITKEISQSKPKDVPTLLLLGRSAFSCGKMTDAIKAYDAIIKQQPEFAPQLWQRGLALYYAGDFREGVKQFNTHQTVNSQDVENSVWHLLCKAQIDGVEKARNGMIAISGDRRVPMSQIFEMFAGRLKPTDVLEAARKTSTIASKDSLRHKLQLYYAHLYIGLFHEMNGEKKLCLDSLKAAQQVSPLSKDNFMGQVARVHLLLRKQDK